MAKDKARTTPSGQKNIGSHCELLYRVEAGFGVWGLSMDDIATFPRISAEGAGAILIDVADAVFNENSQRRIWALAAALRNLDGVRETVPGMNNLMVVFDPLRLPPARLEQQALAAWSSADAAEVPSRLIEVPVIYGGAGGVDLADVAGAKGLSMQALVERHARPVYTVAAVGAMPGFVYLSGLDPALGLARRAVPRMNVPVGSVIIGGAQAGIMPLTAPSGWHILGVTDFPLFDPHRMPPAAFRAGDRIRFVVREVKA